MGEVVNFREESILRIDDEINYRFEEIEEIIYSDDIFEEFCDFVEEKIEEEDLAEKLDNNSFIFYMNDHLDEYFKNHPKYFQYYVKKIHGLVNEIFELLERRFFIKIMNGEVVEWVARKKEDNKYKKNIYITLDDYDQLLFYKFNELLKKYKDLPIRYKIEEKEYGTFLSVRRKIEKTRKEFPDLPIEAMLKKVPKLPSKQNK